MRSTFLTLSLSIKKSHNIYNSKEKVASIKNKLRHSNHVLTKDFKFCKECGVIFYQDKDKFISGVKPANLNYKIEINPLYTILSMKQLVDSQLKISLKNKFHFESSKIIRKKMITKMRNFSKRIKMSILSLHFAIFIMDILTLKLNIFSENQIEKIAIGCMILALKFYELDKNFTTIKNFQLLYETANPFSLCQIRKFEVVCLKNLNYSLNQIPFIKIVHHFLLNGVIFKSDNEEEKDQQKHLRVYCIVYKICENIINHSFYYIQYNQFKLACAIIASARQACHIQRWPNIFRELYQIKEEDFAKENKYLQTITTKISAKAQVYIGKSDTQRDKEKKTIAHKKVSSVSMEITRNGSSMGRNNRNKSARSRSVDMKTIKSNSVKASICSDKNIIINKSVVRTQNESISKDFFHRNRKKDDYFKAFLNKKSKMKNREKSIKSIFSNSNNTFNCQYYKKLKAEATNIICVSNCGKKRFYFNSLNNSQSGNCSKRSNNTEGNKTSRQVNKTISSYGNMLNKCKNKLTFDYK